MSIVRSADDLSNTNEHVTTPCVEDSPPSSRKVSNLHSFYGVVGVTERKLPQVEPMDIIRRTFFIPRGVDGLVHRAEVMRLVDMVDGDTEQYLVLLGDGTRTYAITYDVIVNST